MNDFPKFESAEQATRYLEALERLSRVVPPRELPIPAYYLDELRAVSQNQMTRIDYLWNNPTLFLSMYATSYPRTIDRQPRIQLEFVAMNGERLGVIDLVRGWEVH